MIFRHFKLVGTTIKGAFGPEGIKGLYRNIKFYFSWAKEKATKKDGTAKLNYDQVIAKLGWSQDDIDTRYTQLQAEVYLYSIIGLIALSFAIMNTRYGMVSLAFIGSLSVLILALSLTFRSAFRASQLRDKELYAFSRWIKTPSSWLP